MTVGQILKVTKPITKQRAELVIIIRVIKAHEVPGKKFYVLEARTNIDVHREEIILYTNKKKLTRADVLKSKVWISCSCGDFVYRCEHALYLMGSSSKYYTQGIQPGEGVTGIKVNPLNIPWMCKHLVKIFEKLHTIKTKPGKLPLELAIKHALPEAEKRLTDKESHIPPTKPKKIARKPTPKKRVVKPMTEEELKRRIKNLVPIYKGRIPIVPVKK